MSFHESYTCYKRLSNDKSVNSLYKNASGIKVSCRAYFEHYLTKSTSVLKAKLTCIENIAVGPIDWVLILCMCLCRTCLSCESTVHFFPICNWEAGAIWGFPLLIVWYNRPTISNDRLAQSGAFPANWKVGTLDFKLVMTGWRNQGHFQRIERLAHWISN